MADEVITLDNLSTFKTKADEKYQDKLTAGTNITISEDNTISATGGGTPDEYLKTAEVSGNTLTLTKQDDTTVSFTGGSGGTVVTAEPVTGTGTEEDPVTISNLSPLLPVGSLALEAGDGISIATDSETEATTVSISTDNIEIVAGDGIELELDEENNQVKINYVPDETVLWESSTGINSGTITLSEAPVNFECIGLYIHDKYGYGSVKAICPVYSPEESRYFANGCYYFKVGSDQIIRSSQIELSDSSSTSATVTPISSNNTAAAIILDKVVGINRKES